MKTIKELIEKMNQIDGTVAFNVGYSCATLNLYNYVGNVYGFCSSKYMNKYMNKYTLQEIEADLMAQVNESEIVERLIYESRTK